MQGSRKIIKYLSWFILSAVPRFEPGTSQIRNYVKQSSFEKQMTNKPVPFMKLRVSSSRRLELSATP
jgi:hypothetical protein